MKTADFDKVISYQILQGQQCIQHRAGAGTTVGWGPLLQPGCPQLSPSSWCMFVSAIPISVCSASFSRGERWAPRCLFSLLSVCAPYSLAGPQSPPGTLQITSVFDYICLEHLLMSICGIMKESPRPVLLCPAEMKWCQRVSAAAPSVSQQTEQSPGGNREEQMGGWVLSTNTSSWTHFHQHSLTFHLAKSDCVYTCPEETLS